MTFMKFATKDCYRGVASNSFNEIDEIGESDEILGRCLHQLRLTPNSIHEVFLEMVAKVLTQVAKSGFTKYR